MERPKVRKRFLTAIITAGLLAVFYSNVEAFRTEGSLCGYVPDIGTKEKKFKVAIWGDPQVAFWQKGYNFSHSNYMKEGFKEKFKTVNPRLRQVVELTNRLETAFVVTLGDNVHGSGEWEHYKVFVDICKLLKAPLYMLMGNHDWRPCTNMFGTNPYGKRDYGNFLWAQKELGSPELINYSFDAGDWHFVLFSQPASGDWVMDNPPEYYKWLDGDLEKNRDRPTMFFTHHPLLPVGTRYFDHYGPTATHREKLAEILTRYGNVRYAFFGHVHNTVSSIPLVSWRYKGTAFITLPNSANKVRDYIYREKAKSSWGVAVLELDGRQCRSLAFHTLAGEIIPIRPDKLPEYNDDFYGYLKPEWMWPATNQFINGGFEETLKEGWFVNHVLPYNRLSIQRRLLRSDGAAEGRRYLYLYVEPKGSMGAVLCDVRQAVVAPQKGEWPQISLCYKIFPKEDSERCAAYIAVTGYAKNKSRPSFNLAYSLGESTEYAMFRAYSRRIRNVALLKARPILNKWTDLTLNIRADYEAYLKNPPWEKLNLDKIIVTLGVFDAGVGFDNVVWRRAGGGSPSSDFKMSPSEEKKNNYQGNQKLRSRTSINVRTK